MEYTMIITNGDDNGDVVNDSSFEPVSTTGAIMLDDETLKRIISAVEKHTSSKPAIRIVKHLARHPKTLTINVCRQCAVLNISAYTTKKINPYIAALGFVIRCDRPTPAPARNRFGELTRMREWSFYRLDDTGVSA